MSRQNEGLRGLVPWKGKQLSRSLVLSKAFARVFVVASFGIFSTASFGQVEMDARNDVRLTASLHIFRKNLNELERMSKEFREQQSRTPAGTWKLTYFYDAFESVVEQNQSPNRAQQLQVVDEVVDAWIKNFPESPSASVAKGVVLLKKAWLIRGQGYAGTVPEAAWQPFREGIEKARQYLESVKLLGSHDPAWFCQMTIVAKAQKWPAREIDQLIDESLSRHPYYYPTAMCGAEYYSPRWYFVDRQKIERIAELAVAKTREKDGQTLYARIYWSIASDLDRRVFGTQLELWPKVRAGFEDLIARYPDKWNLNHFARFACRAGDAKAFFSVVERVEFGPEYGVWGGGEYIQCKERLSRS